MALYANFSQNDMMNKKEIKLVKFEILNFRRIS